MPYAFDQYSHGEKKKERKQWLFLAIDLLMLVILLTASIVVYSNNRQLEAVMPEFNSALESHDYEHALSMYRSLQEELLSLDPSATDDMSYELGILNQMEEEIDIRVIAIETNMRDNRATLSADDRAFIEQLGELTGSRFSVWLNSLCEEFLLGTIEKPTLQFIFDQFTTLSNISSATRPLLSEIDAIEISRGDVQAAENYLSNAQYIEAAEKFEDVISSTDGFVYDYAVQRLEDCKLEMYEPMISQCEHMLETYKYYSAEEVLSDLAHIFPEDQRIQSSLLIATPNTTSVYDYDGQVEVICVRPLIADTRLAFEINYVSSTDSLYLTTGEFHAILDELYARDYCLVDPLSMVDVSSDSYLVEQTMKVPAGKKPLIFILENLNYSAYQQGIGLCQRLVINDQGQVCGEYVNADGQTVVSRSSEAIGILDSFVEEHPDFSYNGNKGVISFSGYETLMGYCTNIDQVDDRNIALSSSGLPTINPTAEDIAANCETVDAILSELADTGWTFGSSTYGFINANSCDMPTITTDTDKWLSQVGTLTGQVHILVYPNGDFIKGSDTRCQFLKQNGFRVFFGVGPSPYYTYGDNYLYYDRAMLCGDTLRNSNYSRLFDVENILDSSRKNTR
ncbi:MAG TPA: hypothetical protein PKV44_02600 [Bacillota bacterium]|nr:hypothetical protein [Bacillota bacterium]